MEEKWDIVIRPRRKFLKFNFKEIIHYKDLLRMFIKRDIVTVYKQTILGPIWYVIQPILQMFTFIVIFTKITHISTDGLPPALFYLAGIVIWNYFAEALSSTANTFGENAEIFGKVYFPRIITPLSKIVSGLLKFMIQFSIFLTIYLIYYFTTDLISPTIYILLVPFLLLLMATIGLGFGLIISALTGKYRDLKFLLQFGIQLLLYATPVIYPLSIIPENYRIYFFINPLSHIIETFKFAFFGTGFIDVYGLIYSTAFAICILFTGVLVFSRTEKNFMDTV